ncbi:MAG: hypothetical protein IT376_06965 [Polyangiaceae bacterium]|nr:hypothetical protein [Polyangiaceae bacterium]
MIGASAAVVVAALVACKKDEPAPAPVASAPAVTAEATASASAAPAKDDGVKRYTDKETVESGTVRVAIDQLRVYKEADAATPHIATLSKGTFVNRKARYGNFLLIEYPSAPGTLSPGWIQASFASDKVEKIDPKDVANQDAGVVVTPPPPTSASAPPPPSASAPPTPSATTAPPPSASINVRVPRLGRVPPPPNASPPRPQ